MRAVYRLSLTSPTEVDRLGGYRRACVGHCREPAVPCSSRLCEVGICLISIPHRLVASLVQMVRKAEDILDTVLLARLRDR